MESVSVRNQSRGQASGCSVQAVWVGGSGFTGLCPPLLTCPHTPQQNGVAERKHKHLVQCTLALLS